MIGDRGILQDISRDSSLCPSPIIHKDTTPVPEKEWGFTVIEKYLFFHLHAKGGRIVYRYVKGYVGEFRFNIMLRMLEGRGLVRNGRLVGRKHVLGKRWKSKYDLKGLWGLSWDDFREELFSRMVSEYLYRQEWMIGVKGGIGRLKHYKPDGITEAKARRRQYRRLQREGISTEVRPMQFTVRAFGDWLSLGFQRVSERLRSLREKGKLVYKSIIKLAKRMIPDNMLKYYTGKEYIFNYKGKTMIHYGSLVYFKTERLFSRDYSIEYELVNDCPV